tara:strand:+ start:283 stop:576 length:294 start_codon:yes stop_codon:yes gene_type:complete
MIDIKKIIDSIADDKKDHVLLGMMVGYPLQFLGLMIDIMTGMHMWFLIGTVIALLAVLGKEVIWDWIMGRGNPEVWDFIASAIPIISNLITYLMITL